MRVIIITKGPGKGKLSIPPQRQSGPLSPSAHFSGSFRFPRLSALPTLIQTSDLSSRAGMFSHRVRSHVLGFAYCLVLFVVPSLGWW